jgi:hypothetical protein
MGARRSTSAGARPFAAPRQEAARQEHALGPPTRVEYIVGKGRGVVAARPIAADEIIERAPVLVLPQKDAAMVMECGMLSSYVFLWEDTLAIALGHGSLYNHSYQPNVVYSRRLREEIIEFRALVAVEPGVELCVNYNGDPAGSSVVWFDVR